MSSKCPHCGCTEIEIEPARGDAVCTSCGTVLSDHNIVSEVQFLENSKGGSSAVGQFISNDAISKRTTFSRSYHGVFSRESKEITLSTAYKRIKGLSQQLRLGTHYTETSFNFFKLALNKGLTKGRKSKFIIGACVYITCRTEASFLMLIDVSDALQVDVYELGRTYLKLSTALCITIPAIDPCLYILRFAHKLSFGDKMVHVVSDTALRLVQRMKRDWMHTGRRPSGLCGAALVIAARFHNFNRTISDVIKVVKVHESTLRKRLTEFGETPSSALTPEQFMTMDLNEEQDPPSFKAARKKEKEKEKLNLLFEQQENLDSELTEIQLRIEKHLEDRRKKLRGIWAKYDKEENSYSQKKENMVTQKFIAEATLETIDKCLADAREKEEQEHANSGIGPSAASLGLKSTIEECMKIHPPDPQTSETELLDLTGIDDDEIDSYIMTDREIKFKTELWMKLNEEYLEEMKRKEEREKEEAEQRAKEGKPVKQKKVYKKRQKNTGPANTAGEAIEKMLQDKKLSNKINYDVLRNLNGENDSEKEDKEQLEIKSSTKGKQHPTEPVVKPEKIDLILQSLTGKRALDSSMEGGRSPKQRVVEDVRTVSKHSVDEREEEDEDDDEEEDEEEDMNENEDGDSLIRLLRKRRGENEWDEGEYD
ncbi:Transcription initiation factor IIB [Armadillidium nasatum]|uniref:B-related factor 1 n=1 Tax=Armadillidium nasatum TaxID=96803 RepID=A0A5N5TK54_9CRUS|nr:Transcription initiation factor IIB [Armadillidium nasatum]